MNLYSNEFLNGWYAAKREHEIGYSLENPYDENSQFKSYDDWGAGYRSYEKSDVDGMFSLIFTRL